MFIDILATIFLIILALAVVVGLPILIGALVEAGSGGLAAAISLFIILFLFACVLVKLEIM